MPREMEEKKEETRERAREKRELGVAKEKELVYIGSQGGVSQEDHFDGGGGGRDGGGDNEGY